MEEKEKDIRMSNYADERFVRTRPEDFKTRDDDGNPIIEGYFAVFNSNYELWEGAVETIAPTAFDNSRKNSPSTSGNAVTRTCFASAIRNPSVSHRK